MKKKKKKRIKELEEKKKAREKERKEKEDAAAAEKKKADDAAAAKKKAEATAKTRGDTYTEYQEHTAKIKEKAPDDASDEDKEQLKKDQDDAKTKLEGEQFVKLKEDEDKIQEELKKNKKANLKLYRKMWRWWKRKGGNNTNLEDGTILKKFNDDIETDKWFYNNQTGNFELDIKSVKDEKFSKLKSQYDKEQEEKRAKSEERGKARGDAIMTVLKELNNFGKNHGKEILEGMRLMNKPDIFHKITILDELFSNFLKKPENVGTDKQREISQMGTLVDKDVTGLTGDPYNDCLEDGDEFYDANEEGPSGVMDKDQSSYAVGRAFIKLGEEKFNYKYEDVCFVPDKIKLEEFFQENNDFKFEIIQLLSELNAYEQLTDKSLQSYMESSISGDELGEKEKKKRADMEEKDSKKATKKDEENKKNIKEGQEIVDEIYEKANEMDDEEKEKYINERYKYYLNQVDEHLDTSKELQNAKLELNKLKNNPSSMKSKETIDELEEFINSIEDKDKDETKTNKKNYSLFSYIVSKLKNGDYTDFIKGGGVTKKRKITKKNKNHKKKKQTKRSK